MYLTNMGFIGQQFEFVFFPHMLVTIVNIKERFHYVAKTRINLPQAEKIIYETAFWWQFFRFSVQNHGLSRQMALYYRYFQQFFVKAVSFDII